MGKAVQPGSWTRPRGSSRNLVYIGKEQRPVGVAATPKGFAGQLQGVGQAWGCRWN